MPTETAMTKETFLEKFKNVMFRPFFVDEETGQVQPSHATSAQSVWEDIAEHSRWPTDIPEDADIQRVKELWTDVLSDCINVLTEDEYQAHNARQERQELESYVANVARNANIDPKDTNALLDALQAVIDGAESDLEGAREDGLCIGMGATPEQWYDHCDGIRERGNEARRAIDWLATNAPLAYAAWKERPTE